MITADGGAEVEQGEGQRAWRDWNAEHRGANNSLYGRNRTSREFMDGPLGINRTGKEFKPPWL